jgi:hypothetical protein
MLGNRATPELSKRLREEVLDERSLLHEYSVLGTGVGRDDDGVYMIVALAYDSPRAAERDAPILERRIEEGHSLRANRPWRDYFSQVRVWSEGRVVLGKLRTERAMIWVEIIFNREPMFAHR